MIKLAEASKAKLLQAEGKEESHVDRLIQERIKKGDVDIDISKW